MSTQNDDEACTLQIWQESKREMFMKNFENNICCTIYQQSLTISPKRRKKHKTTRHETVQVEEEKKKLSPDN